MYEESQVSNKNKRARGGSDAVEVDDEEEDAEEEDEEEEGGDEEGMVLGLPLPGLSSCERPMKMRHASGRATLD